MPKVWRAQRCSMCCCWTTGQPQLFVINERAPTPPAQVTKPAGVFAQCQKGGENHTRQAERPKPDQTRAQIERLVSARLFSLGRALAGKEVLKRL
jgi:hypothetical protein